MEYAQLIILSILIEAIWENLKIIWNEKKVNFNQLCVLIISMILCVLTKIDIFPIVGLKISIPYIGCLFTGIIVSRGANFVNDLFKKLSNKGDK